MIVLDRYVADYRIRKDPWRLVWFVWDRKERRLVEPHRSHQEAYQAAQAKNSHSPRVAHEKQQA